MCSRITATLTWSVEEHQLFLKGLETHGKGSWKHIHNNFVKTRTCSQVASHAQKHFLRIARKEAKAFKTKRPRTPRATPPSPSPPSPSPPIRRPSAKLPVLPCPLGSTTERHVYYAPLVTLLNNQVIAHEQKGAMLRAQLLAHEQKGAMVRAQLLRAKFLAESSL